MFHVKNQFKSATFLPAITGLERIPHDGSMQKIRQESLKESEETFRLAMQHSSIGMALVSPAGKWLTVNKALCDMIGYSEAEFLQSDFQSITHPDDLNKDLQNVHKMLRKEITSYQMEKRYFHKDGSIIWVLLSVSLVWNDNGQARYFISQIQDITNRKQIDNELQNQVALLDLAHDAIFVRDQNDRITFWNRGAEATYGWTKKEAINNVTHNILRTVFPKPLEAIRAELALKGQWSGQLIHHCKDGSQITVASRWAIQRDESGQQIGTLEINRDITEREELVKKLLASNTELERFAYIASHDLQEPVRMVSNFSQIIATEYKDKLDEDGREYLHIMNEASIRMRDTIQDLLAYSRVEYETVCFNDFSGADALESALENLKVLIEEKHARISYDTLPAMRGNPVQMVRILQNLVANAIKYQPAENTPHIHIGLSEQGDHWCVSVKDNGLGIGEEFQQIIFEPFKRLHTWQSINGTGLGLSICKKIIESHSGKLWLTSALGEGSTFYFTIPKACTSEC